MKKFIVYNSDAVLSWIMLLVVGIFYLHSRRMVTGWYETLWAAEGVVVTSHNVMMILLMAVSGYGLYWIYLRLFGKKTYIYPLAMSFVFIIIMGQIEVIRWLIPVIVLMTIASIKIKSLRKSR